MKNPLGLIVTIIIILAPIVWCCINLININNESEENANNIKIMQETINDVVDDNISNNDKTTQDKSGESKVETNTPSEDNKPLGKLIEGSVVNVASANVYLENDVNSTIVGAITKGQAVVSQDYPNGWSTVKLDKISGWMRTEYLDKPETQTNTSIGTVIGKNGVITANSLNVRETPITGPIITSLTKDTEVKIMDANSDNSWYQIQWRTTLGWVSSEYVEVKN